MFSRSLQVVVAAGIAGIIVAATGAGCGDPVDPGAPDAAPPDTTKAPCFGDPDGTACTGGGAGWVCVRGICSLPACGDGVLTPPEECDNGSVNGPGSGCEASCKFSCLSTDATRSCQTADDSCTAASTCDATTHKCKPGDPKPTGASCGTGKFCRGTECVAGACGDAVVTAPEACDNGSANGAGTGCEADCSFSCSDATVAACPAVACATPSCGTDHRCGSTPDKTKNGQGCGTGLFCKDGACIAAGAVCGNGIVEGGEDCDFGGKNGPGTGCEAVCKFSCATGGATCVDTNACDAAPTCSPVTVDGKTGQKCVNGASKADGTTCGISSICLAGACKPSFCGDGFRDDVRKEQCDDGNVTKLDACSDTCNFEQDQRVISMKLQFGTDAFCTANAIGGMVGALARGTFQGSIDSSIKDGSVSPLFTFSGDLAGATGGVTVGNLNGAPAAGAGYDGTSDLDWWYTANASSIDASRTARAILTGTYDATGLSATGHLNLIASIGGQIANLAASSSRIKMPVGALGIPKVSAGATPGHVSGEHLLPTLQSYASAGGTGGAPSAQLCGNISAASLENTAPPSSLLPGGTDDCNEKYTTANRMIDIIVHGCHVTGFNVTAVKATQPDQVDPDAPVAGAGGPYTFVTDATTKRVNGCKDKSGADVSLPTCLNAAAYSMSFKFATDRVIIK